MLLAIFSDRIPILARDLMGARTDFVRPGALWTALTIEEYEAMRAHVRGNDFPETSSQWYSLGREAGSAGCGNCSSRRRTCSGCTAFRRKVPPWFFGGVSLPTCEPFEQSDPLRLLKGVEIPDPNAGHLITKLITSSAIQAFPSRLTLSESSRKKPFLDLPGHRRRKQGFDPPRLQALHTQHFTKIV